MTAPAVVSKNAAGVPLVLVATVVNGEPSIDESGVPAGVDGHVWEPEQVAALSVDEAQALMDDLYKKYDGVSVDEGGGTRLFSPEFEMTSADDALRVALINLGAVRPVAVPSPLPPAANVDNIPVTALPVPASAPTSSGVVAPIVAVPDHIASALPVGTIVTQSPTGAHTAHFSLGGFLHSVVGNPGQDLRLLIDSVARYLQSGS